MRKTIIDWAAVQRFHDAGHGFRECASRFGFCHAAWIKAIERKALRLDSSLFADRRRRYNWNDVQAFYDAGHSYRETQARFGFCSATWHKSVTRGRINTRPRKMSIAKLLSSKKRNRTHVKGRLLAENLLPRSCQTCNLDTWLGRPLQMHLDHINGIRNDHRLENLRMLCPNCHSQTPTYGGRNARLRRLQEASATT